MEGSVSQEKENVSHEYMPGGFKNKLYQHKQLIGDQRLKIISCESFCIVCVVLQTVISFFGVWWLI